jgi:uncharacterized membrane-anchored protein YitT (DUF2179 family)
MNLKKFAHSLGMDQKGIWRDFLVIIVGAFIMAVGIGVFLIDAKVVPGGVSGLSMAIYYLSGDKIPVGLTMWLFNIPLFIWGVKELGRQFGARTFVGFSFSSFFIDLIRGSIPGLRHIRMQDDPAIVSLLETDFLFLVLIGGALLGIGLGIIFKFRGSTAGSDIVAAIAQKRWGIKPGMSFMIVDFVVILIAGFIIHLKDLSFDRPALALTFYAFFLLFVSSRIIDVIIDGFDYARSAHIITKKTKEVSNVIMNDLSRGATALEARGLYTDQKKEVLYTVLNRREIGVLVQKVKEIDPDAFIIVNNVHEVLGEGFRPRI